MHPWLTQERAMQQIAVSNVSRILRSYDLVLLPYDLERDRTINKVCFAGIPSPTQHFFTWLCEQTRVSDQHKSTGGGQCAPLLYSVPKEKIILFNFATLWPQPNCPGQCQTWLSQLGPRSGIIITLYQCTCLDWLYLSQFLTDWPEILHDDSLGVKDQV